jgi:hypothetical protein
LPSKPWVMAFFYTTKKAPRREGRRRAGSALGLGGKNQRAEPRKLDKRQIVPRSAGACAKKSPAQGGPARGSSAPGLGGKNERAEPHKHCSPSLVPLRPSFFSKFFSARESAQGLTNFHPQDEKLSRSCRAIFGMRQILRPAFAAGHNAPVRDEKKQ